VNFCNCFFKIYYDITSSVLTSLYGADRMNIGYTIKLIVQNFKNRLNKDLEIEEHHSISIATIKDIWNEFFKDGKEVGLSGWISED